MKKRILTKVLATIILIAPLAVVWSDEPTVAKDAPRVAAPSPAEVLFADSMAANSSEISLSFRENLRCKRYPWENSEGKWYQGRGLIEPMVDYPTLIPGKTHQVEVEKRAASVRLVIKSVVSGEIDLDHKWDLTKADASVVPKLITKGRIGLRHMATKQMIYRDFKVERL